jgi:hypothetical protein
MCKADYIRSEKEIISQERGSKDFGMGVSRSGDFVEYLLRNDSVPVQGQPSCIQNNLTCFCFGI